MRHRDAGIGSRSGRSSDPRYDLERHSRLGQHPSLLGATSEHQRVTSLESHHGPTRTSLGDQPSIDLVLVQYLVTVVTPPPGPFGRCLGVLQQQRVDQAVVKDKVGPLQALEASQSQLLATRQCSGADI